MALRSLSPCGDHPAEIPVSQAIPTGLKVRERIGLKIPDFKFKKSKPLMQKA
jgi:hypothetical protein